MATVTHVLPVKPLFLQAVGSDTPIEYPADVLRHLVGAVWREAGVLRTSHFAVTQRAAGADWSVDITSGYAVVGGGVGNQRYLVYGAGTTNMPLTTFNTAPTATRTHKAWLVLYDKAVSGALYEAQFVITEDTGSGAPTPPNSPSYYFQLGTITIAPAQSNISSAHIGDTRPLASLNLSSHLQLGHLRQVDNLTLETGILNGSGTHGGETPKVTLYGHTVALRGTIMRSSDLAFQAGSTYTLCNLPAAYRPAAIRRMLGAGASAATSSYDWRCQVEPSGIVYAYINNAYSPTYLSLDGIYFEKD
ncbi:MAG: hypothetical protein M3N52_11810 [Actinomycetota bacterium]|nr:hypothetical protein [Actinomycetota bacterium]